MTETITIEAPLFHPEMLSAEGSLVVTGLHQRQQYAHLEDLIAVKLLGGHPRSTSWWETRIPIYDLQMGKRWREVPYSVQDGQAELFLIEAVPQRFEIMAGWQSDLRSTRLGHVATSQLSVRYIPAIDRKVTRNITSHQFANCRPEAATLLLPLNAGTMNRKPHP